MLGDELGLIASRERETEFVDPSDYPLELDPVRKEHRDGDIALLNVPQERVLQRLDGHAVSYFRCCARCLFSSNMVTRPFPKTAFSLSSATISRLFCGFCSLFFLM